MKRKKNRGRIRQIGGILMKIGVSSYSFQQYFNRGEITAEGALMKAAELGFDAIEFTDFNLPEGVTKEYIDGLKALSEEYGIEICAYLTGGNLLANSEEERESACQKICHDLDIAKMLGVSLFRFDVGSWLPKLLSFDMALERALPYMKRIADYGEKLGIMTMIENHGYAFQDWERVEKAYNAMNHRNFALLIDIGNFFCADQDNVLCVSKLANLAMHVHLKDMKKCDFYDSCDKEGFFQSRGTNFLQGTVIGEGDAKAEQCIRVLQKAGYDGYMNMEYEGAEDCVEGLKKSLAFVRGLLEE